MRDPTKPSSLVSTQLRHSSAPPSYAPSPFKVSTVGYSHLCQAASAGKPIGGYSRIILRSFVRCARMRLWIPGQAAATLRRATRQQNKAPGTIRRDRPRNRNSLDRAGTTRRRIQHLTASVAVDVDFRATRPSFYWSGTPYRTQEAR